MSRIKIVTDSTCDMSSEEVEKLNIHVIPLSITIQGETYLDRIEISPRTFMEKMKIIDELPKSSQPAVGEFVKLYDELGADGSEILSIHLSGKLSGTVDSARAASKMTSSKVTVVDSSFISKALAFQVREAAKMTDTDKSLEEILTSIEEVRLATKLYVVVDTLENLVKGGRIGKGKALIGSLLNIKPIALLDEGEYSPVTKVRSKAQAVKYVIKEFLQDINGKTLKSVCICHADGLELAHLFQKKVEELTGFNKIEIVDTTPVISTHTGPGAIGFMYYTE